MKRPDVLRPAARPDAGAFDVPVLDEVPTRLVNHWVDLSEWQGGRELWAFYLTFARHPELQDHVERQQATMSGLPGLDLVQPSWLHLTVQGVAFTDAVDGEALGALLEAGAAVAEAAEPLELVVGTAVAEDDSVCMPVWVSGDMTVLRNDLRDAARGALNGTELYALPEPIGGFAPHITIAYARADCPTVEEVQSRLMRFVEPPLRLDVAALSLVRLNRGTSRWWWSEEHPLCLRSDRARRHEVQHGGRGLEMRRSA